MANTIDPSTKKSKLFAPNADPVETLAGAVGGVPALVLSPEVLDSRPDRAIS
jgi:hypothetical protein